MAVHWNRLWSFNPQTHFVASDINDGYDHIVTNHDAFVAVSGKDEHGVLGLSCRSGRAFESIRQEFQCVHGGSPLPRVVAFHRKVSDEVHLMKQHPLFRLAYTTHRPTAWNSSRIGQKVGTCRSCRFDLVPRLQRPPIPNTGSGHELTVAGSLRAFSETPDHSGGLNCRLVIAVPHANEKWRAQ
ncbi:hypothetical protein RB5707 [Rhodopirellula baltica SH 1]|uniref:Uncharacterized protein n=1 Tax=Rhodopirellula baltica (strain DSM 10527 / NCIMB 13988 / SH1) TaxID=243090 RepID=Q7URF2_RHOBA|nr:hypothetical protein RB5707 [Rhodopirellula baltica SH 1]